MASRAKVRSRELEPLHEHPDVLMLNSDSELPAYLQLFQENATGMVAIFPIFVDSRLVGMISAGFAPETTPGQEDLRQARQVTDQVAVAFSNAALLQQLEELTWGTLTALARTIDASSHWTSGHSERVATMAVRLGEAMRLSPRKLDLLHRGSLIHDIGKIGIPSQILDKPARLTGAEFEIVRTHVQLGARIVEPIAQLEGALPLILQHHEWFNGEGYPEGLAGEEINQMARILTVVDFYDAVRSPRPYRGPTSHEEVMTMVNEGVGVQFDPEVVDAFVKNKTWEARPTPEPLSRAAYG